jgi:hypothetical protein
MWIKARELTQAITYRIDGVDEPGTGPAGGRHWSYIGTLDGVARFPDGQANAVMLELDRLAAVADGHLAYQPQPCGSPGGGIRSGMPWSSR